MESDVERKLKQEAEAAKTPLDYCFFKFRRWKDLIFGTGDRFDFWFYMECCDLDSCAPWDEFLCKLQVAKMLGGSTKKVKVPKNKG